MNRVLLTLSILIGAVPSHAGTVTGTILLPGGAPYTNTVRFRPTTTPTADAGILIGSGDTLVTPASDGQFSVSVEPGRYDVGLVATRGFAIEVPAGEWTNSIDALVISGATSWNTLRLNPATLLPHWPSNFWAANAETIRIAMGGGTGSVLNSTLLTNDAIVIGAGGETIRSTNDVGGRAILGLSAAATNTADWVTSSDPAAARSGLGLTGAATNSSAWATTSDAATARSGLGLTAAATNAAAWATTGDAAAARSGLALSPAATNSAGWATTSDAATARGTMGLTGAATNTAVWSTTSDRATALLALGTAQFSGSGSGVTNIAGVVHAALAAGADIVLSTNAGVITITSVAAGGGGTGSVMNATSLTNDAFVLGAGGETIRATNAAGARLLLGLDSASPGTVGTNLLSAGTASAGRAVLGFPEPGGGGYALTSDGVGGFVWASVTNVSTLTELQLYNTDESGWNVITVIGTGSERSMQIESGGSGAGGAYQLIVWNGDSASWTTVKAAGSGTERGLIFED